MNVQSKGSICLYKNKAEAVCGVGVGSANGFHAAER